MTKFISPNGLIEVAVTSRGNTIFVEPNEAGGRRYWSDEISEGVVIWDTNLVDRETLELALVAEQLQDVDSQITEFLVRRQELQDKLDKAKQIFVNSLK